MKSESAQTELKQGRGLNKGVEAMHFNLISITETLSTNYTKKIF